MAEHPSTFGVVEAIHIATQGTGPVRSLASCEVVAGKGLTGDRYAGGVGTFSKTVKDFELTLVEAEALEAIAALGFVLAPGESRRNLTTRGISLNDLVGQEFTIGPVRCRGTRLCAPCNHLETLLGRPGLMKAMANRGGLRVTILTGGTITVGDSIEFAGSREPSSPPGV